MLKILSYSPFKSPPPPPPASYPFNFPTKPSYYTFYFSSFYKPSYNPLTIYSALTFLSNSFTPSLASITLLTTLIALTISSLPFCSYLQKERRFIDFITYMSVRLQQKPQMHAVNGRILTREKCNYGFI